MLTLTPLIGSWGIVKAVLQLVIYLDFSDNFHSEYEKKQGKSQQNKATDNSSHFISQTSLHF